MVKAFARGILAAAALLAGAAPAQQPVELRFASPAPPQSPINSRGIANWVKEVTAASQGTLTIRVVPGQTLATFENVYDRVLQGVADIGFGTQASIGGQFPRTEVVALPFETENPLETAVALWRIHQRGLIAEEYSAVKPLALFAFPHNLVHTRVAGVRSMADLKGLKLRIGGKIDGDIAVALGAAPVALTPSDSYQALSSGLVGGAIFAWTAVDTFRLYEVMRYHISAPISAAAAFIIMNKRSYEKLPPQARAAIDKYSGEPLVRAMGGVVQAMEDFAVEKVRKMPGHEFVPISPEERARWRKQLETISANWVKSTPNGPAIVAGFREEVEKFRAEKPR